MMYLKTILAAFCTVTFVSCLDFELNFLNKYKDGEKRYKELVVKSYGSCWHEALSNLHTGCKELTEEVQSRLSLSFTNCFLSFTGSEICLCSSNEPISSCLRNSSDRVFSTFTEFYTHTQSICHYLQHKEWQKQTEKTVMMLSDNAQEVAEKLDQSKESLTKVLDLQKTTSHEHKKLIANGRKLNEELLKSKHYATSVFGEFKSAAVEQNILLHAVSDRVKILQNLVLGEFTTIYTVAYFIIALFITYLLTSLPQTANARFWLTKVFCINGLVEYCITSSYLGDEVTNTILDDSGPIYSKISICRKIACSVSFLILVYFYKTYKNYEAINNKLLEEIRLQNIELQQLLHSGFTSRELTSTPINFVRNKTVPPVEKDNLDQLKSKPIPAQIFNAVVSPVMSPAGTNTTSPKTSALKKKKAVYAKSNVNKENLTLLNVENINETGSGKKGYNLRNRQSSSMASTSKGMTSTSNSESLSFLR